MRLWRPGAAGFALATVICFIGCRLSRDFPPQPVKIVGMSYSPGIGPQVVPPSRPEGDWTKPGAAAERTISAWGDAEVPAMALDPVQGRLIARQMAKQAARRNLARKVEGLEVRSGQTVGDIIRDDPEKRQRLEELIREARQKGLIKNDGGRCSIFLTLDLRPLNKILNLEADTLEGASTVTTGEVSLEGLRKRAEQEALDNARIRALEHLKSRTLKGSETLGQRMLRDDALDRAVRQKVEVLHPAAVRFHEDGTCEVAVVIDLADIQRLVAPRRFGL